MAGTPPPDQSANGDGVNMVRMKQQPIRLGDAHKREVSSQFAALCYRVRDDKVQILLVTSRGTGRWIVPKGWPMDDATPSEAAAQEAWEEAGVEGKAIPICLGIYSYQKKLDDGEILPCVVSTFPIKVKQLAKSFPEAGQRKRKWFSKKEAAALVSEPELAAIIRHFDPTVFPK